MDAIDAIEQIKHDFEQRNPPFEDVEFPEERLLENVKIQAGDSDDPIHLSKEERLQLLSGFSMLDYNRDANQLTDTLLELHERKPKWFDPYGCPMGQSGIEHVFEDIGFRYPTRDAKTWQKNNSIIRHQYAGEWSELLIDTGMNAPTLIERLNSDDFNVLKGDKVAPMYTRFIDEYIGEMNDLWLVDIPVDVHINTLTEKLTGEEMSNDDVRAWWGVVSKQHDIPRHVVDAGLWQIGNNWNSWGEDYWNEL